MTFRHLLLIFLVIQILNLADHLAGLFGIEFHYIFYGVRVILYLLFFAALLIKLLSHQKVKDFLNT
jgi:hypothetical protein